MNLRTSKAVRTGRCVAAILAAAFLGVVAGARGAESPAAPVQASAWWRDLDVRGLDGRPLDPAARWFVVIFLSRECPVSNVSVPVLNKLDLLPPEEQLAYAADETAAAISARL